jgi:hypothetical protein
VRLRDSISGVILVEGVQGPSEGVFVVLRQTDRTSPKSEDALSAASIRSYKDF